MITGCRFSFMSNKKSRIWKNSSWEPMSFCIFSSTVPGKQIFSYFPKENTSGSASQCLRTYQTLKEKNKRCSYLQWPWTHTLIVKWGSVKPESEELAGGLSMVLKDGHVFHKRFTLALLYYVHNGECILQAVQTVYWKDEKILDFF